MRCGLRFVRSRRVLHVLPHNNANQRMFRSIFAFPCRDMLSLRIVARQNKRGGPNPDSGCSIQRLDSYCCFQGSSLKFPTLTSSRKPDNPAAAPTHEQTPLPRLKPFPARKRPERIRKVPVVPAAGHSEILLEAGSRAIAGQTCVDGWLCVPNA